MIRYLITGTGRCGTGYAANVLASAAVPCGHEAIFSHGGLEAARRALAEQPGLAAESSWLAAPFLPNPLLRDAVVVHLVRHPVKTIESIISVGMLRAGPYGDFARRYAPDIARWQSEDNAAVHFYVAWNLMVRFFTDKRHRVEDDPRRLLETLGIEHDGRPLFGDTAYNHRPEHPPHALDLDTVNPKLRGKLERMAADYGYTL